MTYRIYIVLAMLLFPIASQASWWNDEWSYRKYITLDTSPTGANITEPVNNAAVLIRLHTGNFGYFLDLSPNGEDIRFVSSDDITPLKYHIEKLDAINEMALIWVQIPQLVPGSNTQSIWMYYGNPLAAAGDEPSKSFEVNQAAVYHFEANPPKDATAYATNPKLFSAEIADGALIGKGLVLNGESSLTLPAVPSLIVDPDKGWMWSTWIKVDAAQPTNAVVFEINGTSGGMFLGVEGQSAFAGVRDAGGNVLETAKNTALTSGVWHHLALRIDGQRLSILLDGGETAFIDAAIPSISGELIIGNSFEGGRGFVGMLDELQISNVSRSDSWLQTQIKSQGLNANLVLYGEDGSQSGGGGEPSYMTTILSNVALDGWVVVIALAIMSAISWVVMISKGFVISRMAQDNSKFQADFAKLGLADIASLDDDDTEKQKQLDESAFLTALSGKHDHFQSSNIYRLYHAGVQEMFHRMPKSVGAQAVELNLSNQAINAIKATMDAAMMRENQRLNSQMVLLTIAISGGPFLGLLGTVLGVMITFAAIAASGDVNVNAIAPGTAAALFTTVAGLFVAIPALFGYNYLGSRIREISADMRVFVDEFVAKIAEQHS